MNNYHFELFENLDSKTTILTPNRRLAINLTEEFNNYQINKQKIAWEKFNIQFIDEWLQQLFFSQSQNYILLTNYQEQLLWEKIISNSDFWKNNLTGLNSVSNIVQEAQTAWRLIQQWHLNPQQWLSLQLSENHSAFKSWANEFITICQKNYWVDKSNIINTLIVPEIIDELLLPDKIVMVSFDYLYPQLNQFVDVIRDRGCKVVHFDTNNKNGYQYRVSFSNNEQELKSMALWANECIRKEPSAMVGCIVPNLETFRPQIEYTFNEINGVNFDISIGKPLAQFSIICDALKALKLWHKDIDIKDIYRLLRSPFFSGSDEEMSSRAMLDRELRKTKEYTISIHQILALAKNPNNGYFCPILAMQIDEGLNLFKKQPRKQTFANWSKFFINQLTLFGWGLTSQEYQTIKRWHELLQEFSLLDLIEKPITFEHALGKIKALASNCIFQPKLLASASIKILGSLEAAGLNFDYLWIMGLTDESWPPKPKPNLFIPLEIQKKFALPHVNSERELEFCRTLMQRFSKSADYIIYSYPLQNKEQEYQPSPLIIHPDIGIMEFPIFETIKFLPIKLETIVDDKGSSVIAEEVIRGGSKIFKLQAACPFWAFAECRLMAYELDKPKLGLDYRERGNIVHAALACFWNMVNNKQELSSYNESELQNLIAQCIVQSFRELKLLNKACLEVERKRLQKILFDWVQLEKQRLDFKVIAKEKIFEFTLADIKLQLRVDRIDELPDGSLLVMDYKTGEVSSFKKWDDERLDEPQLPLYCLISDAAFNSFPSGAIVGQLKNGKLGFLGITKENYSFPKSVLVANDWDEVVIKWRNILEKLGHSFNYGLAEVNPKYGEKTCSRCALQSLCRVSWG